MRGILAIAAVAVAIGWPGAVSAQDTKTAEGVVSATAPDAVTVRVDGREVIFKVDSSTRIRARGGTTAMREARAEGKTGMPYTDFVKAGQTVEVTYHEKAMHAVTIRVMSSGPAPSRAAAASPPAAPPGGPRATTPVALKAVGVVTAVSNDSLRIQGGRDELTFGIDGDTKVVGPGLGTQAREMKRAGENLKFSEFVHKGDSVEVRYTETAGTRRASEVRVTRKSS